LKSITQTIQNPAGNQGPWAIWHWNRLCKTDQILEQFDSFVNDRFEGVIIQPDRDMEPVFGSEEFYLLLLSVLRKAQQNDVRIRIGIDFALPWSGVGSAQVVGRKNARAHYLHLQKIYVRKGESFSASFDQPENVILLACRCSSEKIDVETTVAIDVSNSVEWMPPTDDEWKIFHFTKQYLCLPDNTPVANPFDTSLVSDLIANVFEPLKNRLSEFQAETFVGFVVETPALTPRENAVIWDDDLAPKYKNRFKKDLLKLLPILFHDCNALHYKLRSHIQAFIAQNIIDRFSGAIDTWARKFKLNSWVLAADGNNASKLEPSHGLYAYTDTKINSFGIASTTEFSQSYVWLRSNADINAIEHRREQLLVLGRSSQSRSLSVPSLKSIVDQSLSFGQSTVIIDGFFANLDRRSTVKTALAPFWYSPENTSVSKLVQYIGKMQNIMADSQYAPAVAVVMPTVSCASDLVPGGYSHAQHSVESFYHAVNTLRQSQIPFDVISENYLLSCQPRTTGEFGSAVRVRKGNYQVLVVPYSRYCSKGLFVFVEKLAVKGGKTVFLDDVPAGNLDDGQSKKFADRVDKLVQTRKEIVKIVPTEKLEPILSDWITPEAIVKNNGKRSHSIRLDTLSYADGVLYSLCNSSIKNDFQVQFFAPSSKHFYLVDLETNAVNAITPQNQSNGKDVFSLNFLPRQNYLIAACENPIESANQESQEQLTGIMRYQLKPRNYRIVLKDQWQFVPETLNANPLAVWNTRIGLSRDSGGFSHFYESSFHIRGIPSICLLACNGLEEDLFEYGGFDQAMEITVNGNKLTPKPFSDYSPEVQKKLPEFTTHTALAEIREYLTRGANRIAVRTMGSFDDPAAIMYPPLILGHFTLAKGTAGWIIDTDLEESGYGSWVKYGYSYLSGKGRYKQVFEIPNQYNAIVLRASEISGGAEIFINDEKVKSFSWHPMEIDITQMCKNRRNALEIVVENTVDNVLRMNGRPSGLLGEVYVDVY